MKNYIENVHTKIKAAAKQWNNTAERHRVECEDSKKALELSKAELEVLHKSVASSSAAVVLPDPNSLDGRHLNDTSKASTLKNLEEATKIQGTPHDKCVLDNSLLQLEVETQKIKLGSYHIQNWVHQKKLKDQIKKLRTKLHEMERKLLLHDPVKSVNITELQIKFDTLSKELEVRAAERHAIESSNQNLLHKEHVNTHKLNEAQKELLSLKTQLHVMEGMLDRQSKQLQERTTDMEDMESLIQVLLVKERLNNDELQEARKELKLGLQGLLSQRSFIGIKRMRELNHKPFRDVCKKKFASEDWGMKSLELCSFWQENINNSQWFPFKTVQINGNFNRVIDDEDAKLKQLKDDLGEQVYKAVCVALSEMDEYNPSGRSIVAELWNFKEDRRARLKEVVEYLLKQLKRAKSQKRRS